MPPRRPNRKVEVVCLGPTPISVRSAVQHLTTLRSLALALGCPTPNSGHGNYLQHLTSVVNPTPVMIPGVGHPCTTTLEARDFDTSGYPYTFRLRVWTPPTAVVPPVVVPVHVGGSVSTADPGSAASSAPPTHPARVAHPPTAAAGGPAAAADPVAPLPTPTLDALLRGLNDIDRPTRELIEEGIAEHGFTFTLNLAGERTVRATFRLADGQPSWTFTNFGEEEEEEQNQEADGGSGGGGDGGAAAAAATPPPTPLSQLIAELQNATPEVAAALNRSLSEGGVQFSWNQGTISTLGLSSIKK